jgi:hypothetical protein
VSERVLGTIAAIVIIIAAGWAMRRAGNELREMMKGGKK